MCIHREYESLKPAHVETIEHKPDYKCKGLCHKDMRCIDLPGHEKICTAVELVLSRELVCFLQEKLKEVAERGDAIDKAWVMMIENLINKNKIGAVVPKLPECGGE